MGIASFFLHLFEIILRGGVMVTCKAHNLDATGSNPVYATNGRLLKLAIILGLHPLVLGSSPKSVHNKDE